MKPIKAVKTEVRNFLRAMPRFILLASLFAYLVTDDIIALRFALYFFIAEILSHFLKGATKLALKKEWWIYRPDGAGHCNGCGVWPQYARSTDLFASCLDVSGNTGMPSGHSLSSTFAATFWIMYIWNKQKSSLKHSKLIKSIILVIVAFAVMLSRSYVVENCHTIPQILVGGIIGVGLGVGAYELDKRYIK